jgi:HlyD family type I secretion membrane fusion protein
MKEKIDLDGEFLEIEHKRVNFLPRILLSTLVFIIILTIIFLAVVKNEVFATSTGVLIYPGKLKVVTAPFSGMIETIYVKEGDEVEVGQPLFKMNESIVRSELAKLSIMRSSGTQERYRLESLSGIITWQQKLDHQNALEQFDKNWVSNPELKDNPAQMRIIERDYQRFRGELFKLTLKIQDVEKKIAISQSNIDRLRSSVSLKKMKMEVYEKTYRNGVSNIIILLDAKISYNKSLSELDSELARIESGKSDIVIFKNDFTQLYNNLLNDYSVRIDRLQSQVDKIEQDIDKYNYMLNKLVVRTPVAGKIQERFIVTDDSGIELAQKVLSIVPRGEQLMADVYVKTSDIGFIQNKQAVSVKVDSFPFTVYGLIKGQVVFISNDASYDTEHGLCYKVRVKLNNDYLVNDNQKFFIRAGMSVKADIHLTERRLISYLSSPVVKILSEGFKER